jgi:hypothetical protein
MVFGNDLAPLPRALIATFVLGVKRNAPIDRRAPSPRYAQGGLRTQ